MRRVVGRGISGIGIAILSILVISPMVNVYSHLYLWQVYSLVFVGFGFFFLGMGIVDNLWIKKRTK